MGNKWCKEKCMDVDGTCRKNCKMFCTPGCKCVGCSAKDPDADAAWCVTNCNNGLDSGLCNAECSTRCQSDCMCNACSDSSTWRQGKDTYKDCTWVAEKPSKRCSKKGDDGGMRFKAKKACA